MKIKYLYITVLCLFFVNSVRGQETPQGTFLKPIPRNYEVKQALEVETLFPMFLYGGYHVGVGYRYKRFRIRTSIIDGGNFNTDGQMVNGGGENFERYYTPSLGIFAGYNVWKNLAVYGYYERHTFEIKQLSTGDKAEIPSNDFGIGMSYQFFIGRRFYIQPGVHSYFRASEARTFPDGEVYEIPTMELTPIIRIGYRFYGKF